MEIEYIVTITTLLTVVLFAVGVPVVLCLGTWAMITLYYTDVFPIANIGQSAFFGLKYFSLLAMPLFILTGDLISAGGISKRLIKFRFSRIARIQFNQEPSIKHLHPWQHSNLQDQQNSQIKQITNGHSPRRTRSKRNQISRETGQISIDDINIRDIQRC